MIAGLSMRSRTRALRSGTRDAPGTCLGPAGRAHARPPRAGVHAGDLAAPGRRHDPVDLERRRSRAAGRPSSRDITAPDHVGPTGAPAGQSPSPDSLASAANACSPLDALSASRLRRCRGLGVRPGSAPRPELPRDRRRAPRASASAREPDRAVPRSAPDGRGSRDAAPRSAARPLAIGRTLRTLWPRRAPAPSRRSRPSPAGRGRAPGRRAARARTAAPPAAACGHVQPLRRPVSPGRRCGPSGGRSQASRGRPKTRRSRSSSRGPQRSRSLPPEGPLEPLERDQQRQRPGRGVRAGRRRRARRPRCGTRAGPRRPTGRVAYSRDTPAGARPAVPRGRGSPAASVPAGVAEVRAEARRTPERVSALGRHSSLDSSRPWPENTRGRRHGPDPPRRRRAPGRARSTAALDARAASSPRGTRAGSARPARPGRRGRGGRGRAVRRRVCASSRPGIAAAPASSSSGSGACRWRRAADRRAFVGCGGTDGRAALANNRYSADIVAIVAGRAPARPPGPARGQRPAPLAGGGGRVAVADLRAAWRLAVDLDSPLDLRPAGAARRSARASAATSVAPRTLPRRVAASAGRPSGRAARSPAGPRPRRSLARAATPLPDPRPRRGARPAGRGAPGRPSAAGTRPATGVASGCSSTATARRPRPAPRRAGDAAVVDTPRAAGPSPRAGRGRLAGRRGPLRVRPPAPRPGRATRGCAR